MDNANAGLAAAQRQYEAAQASLRQAEANDLKAQDDVNRYKPLAAKDEIPQQLYTQAVDSQKATAAAVEAARASAAARRTSGRTGSGETCASSGPIAIRPDPASANLGAAIPSASGAGRDRARHRDSSCRRN